MNVKKILWITYLALTGCSRVGSPQQAQAEEKPLPPAPAIALREEELGGDIRWGDFPKAPPEAPSKGAQVLWVAPGGSGDGSEKAPLGSVAEAIARAKPGAWVWVAPGEYREGPPGEHVALRIKAAGLTVAARGGEAVIKPLSPTYNYGVVIEADGVSLRGLRLEGFASNGVVLSSGAKTQERVVLQDVTVQMAPGTFNNGLLITENAGLAGAPVLKGLRLERVRLEGASLGFSCGRGPCVDLLLDGITVKNRGSEAGSGADALAVESGDNIVIRDAELSGAGADGIDLKATRVLISGVHVHHNARNGIKLWHGGRVFNALVDHHGADVAISLGAPGSYRLAHVLVAYHNHKGPSSYVMTVGYGQSEAVTLTIENSAFWRNAGGIYLSAATEAKITHTILAESDNQKLLEQGERYVLSTGDKDALAPWGAGNLALRSLELPEDFVPPPGSPLRDAGAVLEGAPGRDQRGAPRHQGRAPDIGPRESAAR